MHYRFAANQAAWRNRYRAGYPGQAIDSAVRSDVWFRMETIGIVSRDSNMLPTFCS
jgi:hypothetical protein